jgi:hypothetical protein
MTGHSIEIRFFLNGAQHVLQFGPWAAGQFQPSQGALNGQDYSRDHHANLRNEVARAKRTRQRWAALG